MCLWHKISCIPQGNKGFANLMLILSEKKDSPLKTLHQLTLGMRKCCYLLGKLEKFNHFFLYDGRNSYHLIWLKKLYMARPHARLLHFSTLAMGWHITRTGLDLAKTSKSHSQIFDLILKGKKKGVKHQLFLFWILAGQQKIVMGHWQHLCIDTEKQVMHEHVALDVKQQIREVLFKGIYTKVKVKIDQRQQSAPIQLNRIFFLRDKNNFKRVETFLDHIKRI